MGYGNLISKVGAYAIGQSEVTPKLPSSAGKISDSSGSEIGLGGGSFEKPKVLFKPGLVKVDDVRGTEIPTAKAPEPKEPATPPTPPAQPTRYSSQAEMRRDFDQVLDRLTAGANLKGSNEFQGNRGDRTRFVQAAGALESLQPGGTLNETTRSNLTYLGFTNDDIDRMQTDGRYRNLTRRILTYIDQNWGDSGTSGVNYITDDNGNEANCGGCISDNDLLGLRYGGTSNPPLFNDRGILFWDSSYNYNGNADRHHKALIDTLHKNCL
jgi:hypothetical protein